MIRSIRCKLHALGAILVVGATILPAHAEAPDAVAMALFRKGRDLVAQGDWAKGCEKLTQSFARQASASTLLNLARCDEHEGRITSAWTRHHQALPLAERVDDVARREELVQLVHEGLARLEPRLPKLLVVVHTDAAGMALVDEGGRALPIGEEVPLDPGLHTVTARAPGYREMRSPVVLSEGRTTELVVTLVQETARAEPAPIASPPAPASRPFPWAGVSMGTLGLAAAAVAVGFGVDAANASHALEARCGADLVCTEDPSFDPEPLNARKNQSFALAIGVGSVGVIALGAAAWLLFRSSQQTRGGAILPASTRRSTPGTSVVISF